MKFNRVISLLRYSYRTLWRNLGSFVVLFFIGTVGVYLLTTSLLLFKCSADVMKSSSLPYSEYHIVAIESSKDDILSGKTVSYFGGYEIYRLLQAHECVEDIVYSADDTIETNMTAISMDDSENTILPVIALFSSSLESDFRSGKNILVKGRHISRSDIDSILISEELAQMNELSLGDTVELGKRDKKEYHIVGIYKNVSNDANILTYQDIPSNMIYISHGDGYFSQHTHDLFVKFTDEMGNKEIEDFCHYINEFPWGIAERIDFISVNELNHTSEGGVSVLYDITLSLSMMIGVTMIFIVGVMIYYHILARQKEIGMLRTIGEQRIDVIFLTELCTVSVLSSIIGSIIACMTSKGVSKQVFHLINELLNTSNSYNTNSVLISSMIVKQQTMIEYMTVGTYFSCSLFSSGIILISIMTISVILIHQSKQNSPIEIMGRN